MIGWGGILFLFILGVLAICGILFLAWMAVTGFMGDKTRKGQEEWQEEYMTMESIINAFLEYHKRNEQDSEKVTLDDNLG